MAEISGDHGEIRMNGYVTIFSAIDGYSAGEIERRLGYAPQTLRQGYVVYALTARLGIQDFDWQDRTRYSDGWRYERDIGEYVQRKDELRAHFGKLHGYDEAKSDSAIATFKERQLARLNVRHGREKIVKLRPNAKPDAFPDSPYPDIPQWKLTTQQPFVLLYRLGA